MFIVFLLLFLPPLTLIQMVVHVFLFTDLLLLTKAAKGKNFTIVRPVSTLKLMYGHIPSRFPSNSGHTFAQKCASLRTLCKSKLHEEACMHTCMFACKCTRLLVNVHVHLQLCRMVCEILPLCTCDSVTSPANQWQHAQYCVYLCSSS